MRYLLDTNVVINFLSASLPIEGMKLLNSIVDEESNISVVTKIETLGFNFKSFSEQATMKSFINGSSILNLNDDIVNTTIELRKKHKKKLPDAIIAATALVYDLILITRNVSDFNNIDNLSIINPFSLEPQE